MHKYIPHVAIGKCVPVLYLCTARVRLADTELPHAQENGLFLEPSAKIFARTESRWNERDRFSDMFIIGTGIMLQHSRPQTP